MVSAARSFVGSVARNILYITFLLILAVSGGVISCASSGGGGEASSDGAADQDQDVVDEFEDEEGDEAEPDDTKASVDEAAGDDLENDGDPAADVDAESADSKAEEKLTEPKAGEKVTTDDGAPAEDDLAEGLEDDFALDEEEKPAAETEKAAETKSAKAEDPAPKVDPVVEAEEIAEDPALAGPVGGVSGGDKTATVTDISYKSELRGGTVVVETSAPVTYKTRQNADGQLVVEIDQADLPSKIKRPLITKDFPGAIVAVNAYQSPETGGARIVVQLRGGGAPAVKQDGNRILIFAGGSGIDEESVSADNESAEAAVLKYRSLDEFLLSNQKFYGRKISVEVTDAEIQDVLNLIAEESGLNMVISNDVKGTLSVKLRDIPWDQALILILRSQKLGYQRQGSVIRVAPLAQLKTESQEMRSMAEERRQLQPIRVKVISVSYAVVAELATQVTPFLSTRGKVSSDKRTSALVVTDVEENIERIEKLVAELDVPPAQVLIEGKVIEAADTFSRDFGVNWGFSGEPTQIANRDGLPVNLTPSLSIAPTGSSVGATGLDFNLNVGTLNLLGDINARLALFERESRVKILSSPRISTLTNEKATITQVTEVPLISSNNNNGVVTQSVTFKPVELRLEVTPQVTSDNSVVLEVTMKREFAGEIVEQNTQARPINRREATTKVLVKNGQTAVLGGIYQSDATESDQGVPGLRRIPLFGRLFESKSRTKDKNELLIFLTPRIIGEPISGRIE